jgi:hypothetical protein
MGAIGDSYATIAELEQRLGKDDDGTFAALLDAASRAVESFTGRQFNREDVASPRRFRAVDWHRLPVDDFHTVTDLAVEVDGAAWDVTDVDPRPWNGIVNGMTGWPFFDLLAISRHWPWSRRGLTTVTAQWGWAAVPEGIKQATLDVAAVMSFGSGSGSGQVRSESIDGYSVTFQVPELSTGDFVPSEMAKAAPYRRLRFGVA